jgi:hypothetical protein
MLNLPISFEEVNLLICAIGGGYDIFGTLPIVYSLPSKNIILSSFNLNKFEDPIYDMREKDTRYSYFPENILIDTKGLPILNVSGKVGVVPLREYYKELIDRYGIGRIITVDCGVDSLMHGDEESSGTILEEYVNFAALRSIDIPKTHICLGFGTEVEERISHYRVLENISELIRLGGFHGSCSMTSRQSSFKRYRESYNRVNEYVGHKRSHIHPRIINAVEGFFGEMENKESTLMVSKVDVFISPLMCMYWFFDGDVVIDTIPILESMKDDSTFMESSMRLRGLVKSRSSKSIPY